MWSDIVVVGVVMAVGTLGVVGLAAARSGQYLRDDDRQQGAAEAAAGG
jgi:hypothetical protein